MDADKTLYHGYILQPLAAYEDGAYASMFILQPPGGSERASYILGHFADAADAKRFALKRGRTEIDCLLLAQEGAESKTPGS
jgi:hypothetical protein